MKQVLLAAAMLLSISFTAQAQVTTVDNQTGCDIDVMQVCYDAACIPISIVVYTVPANMVYTIPTTCPSGSITGYNVCWADPACAGACVTVDGSPFPGCAGTYNGVLPPCPACWAAPAMVDYDPAADLLRIF